MTKDAKMRGYKKADFLLMFLEEDAKIVMEMEL